MIIFGSSNEPARSAPVETAAHRPSGLIGKAIFALCALGLMAGCATRGGDIPYNVELAQPDAPSEALGDTQFTEYRISPLDKLQVIVFQVPDMSREVDVDLGGNISMPLIGSVRAVDLTTAQLQDRLEQQLGQRYLRNPDVTVTVRESSRRHVTVDGSVRNPGQFPLSGPTTLLQVVARAGGTSEDSNPRRVAVFRQIEGRRNAAAFDLTAIRRGNAEDPVIYTGDIIVVDGSRLRALQRELMSTIPLLTTFRPF